MDESNTAVSAYTLYRHLQQYCSHPSICRKYTKDGCNDSAGLGQALQSIVKQRKMVVVYKHFLLSYNGLKSLPPKILRYCLAKG